MAKEVAGLIKLQIKGGAANPSPPVGPALGSKGINIMGFCKEFNARTQDKVRLFLSLSPTTPTSHSASSLRLRLQLFSLKRQPRLRVAQHSLIVRKLPA